MSRVAEQVGVVVIGRNEAASLPRCLASVLASLSGDRVVYADSCSNDASVLISKEQGVSVVELDPGRPLSAGRGRNEGFFSLDDALSELEYVQFVDGDCELDTQWLGEAALFLDSHPEVAIVCGCLRERGAAESVFSCLLDLEWRRSTGDVRECGGLFMIRCSVFRQLGGFNEMVPAGEEPDLCARVRSLGLAVFRLEAPMAIHDAGHVSFGDWWGRAVRSGFGYAQSVLLGNGYGLRPVAGIIFWSGIFPFSVLALGVVLGAEYSLLGIFYLVLFAKIAISRLSVGWKVSEAALYGASCVVCKFPQLLGVCLFVLANVRRRMR